MFLSCIWGGRGTPARWVQAAAGGTGVSKCLRMWAWVPRGRRERLYVQPSRRDDCASSVPVSCPVVARVPVAEADGGLPEIAGGGSEVDGGLLRLGILALWSVWRSGCRRTLERTRDRVPVCRRLS